MTHMLCIYIDYIIYIITIICYVYYIKYTIYWLICLSHTSNIALIDVFSYLQCLHCEWRQYYIYIPIPMTHIVWLRVSEANEVPNPCLNDIQTTLKPLKIQKILGLDKSFKTMNRPNSIRPGPARPWRSQLTVCFSESIEDRDVKFWHNLCSSLQFMLWIDIFDSLETLCFLPT